MKASLLRGLLGFVPFLVLGANVHAGMMEIAFLVGDGGPAIFRFAPDGTFIDSITTVGAARSLAYGSDGTLYYTSSGAAASGLYRVIDNTNGVLLSAASALRYDGAGTDLDISPSGEIAFLVGDGGPAIFRFAPDGTFIDSITTVGAARSLAYGSDGTLYYTSSGAAASGLYRVIDNTNGVLLSAASALRYDGAGTDLDISPSGEIAFLVGDGGPAIFRFAPDGTFIDSITTVGAARSLAYGSDGTLYYTSSGAAASGLYRVIDNTNGVLLSAASALRYDGPGTSLAISPIILAVPEPSTFALLGIGGIALVGYGWRRKRQQAA